MPIKGSRLTTGIAWRQRGRLNAVCPPTNDTDRGGMTAKPPCHAFRPTKMGRALDSAPANRVHTLSRAACRATMERWPSGRRRSPAKGVYGQNLYREFKSLPLRQTTKGHGANRDPFRVWVSNSKLKMHIMFYVRTLTPRCTPLGAKASGEKLCKWFCVSDYILIEHGPAQNDPLNMQTTYHPHLITGDANATI